MSVRNVGYVSLPQILNIIAIALKGRSLYDIELRYTELAAEAKQNG